MTQKTACNSAVMPLVLADIDDNFGHTVKKFRKYVGDENTLGTPIVIDAAGKPLSYASEKQMAFARWLLSTATVTPVTGRSREKYLQVNLGFSGHAIVSFGGLILLADGTPDPTWYEHIAAAARAEKDVIASYQADITRGAADISADLKVSRIVDEGLDLLIKVQNTGEKAAEEMQQLSLVMQQLLPAGWTLHVNEGQLCAYPPFLGKELAVRYYLDNLAPAHSLLIGSGDSLTDVGFMSLCDMMLAPTQSQVFKTLHALESHN